MILDRLESADRYAALHPLFAAGFAFLRGRTWEGQPDGRVELDGARMYALPSRDRGRGRTGAKLETHRKYIDIQFVAEGDEWMGWEALEACRSTGLGYDGGRDIEFYTGAPRIWIPVPPGHFTIFFPEDAHAPLAGDGPVRKIVVKVRVDS